MLRRNPGFASLIVATMALGLGSSITMFSMIQAVFLRPLPFPHPDRLVTLWESDRAAGAARRLVTPANFVDWAAQSRSFEALGALDEETRFKIASAGRAELVSGAFTSSGLFQALGAAPALGHFFNAGDDHRRGIHEVIISSSYWQSRFQGDPSVIGKTLDVDTYDGGAFTIIGVLPDALAFPRDAQIWLSMADSGTKPLPLPDASQRCCSWFTVVARLKPGASPAQAEAEMSGIASRISQRHPTATAVPAVSVVPLRDYLVGDHRVALFALWGAVTCLLLIGCANVANLMLSRGVSREREMLTRTALGASRWEIARQLLSESLILCALGAAGGVLTALWAQDALVRAFSGRIPLLDTTRIDGAVLAFALLLTVAAALFCAIAPMIHVHAAAWQLRSQTENPRARRLRDVLVTGEIALSLVLVAAAGLLIRTFVNLNGVNLGIRTSRILAVFTDVNTEGLRERGNTAAFLDELLPRLRALPGTTMVAAARTGLPTDTGTLNPISPEYLPARTSAESPQVYQAAVTPDYFSLMGIPLKSGRLFSPEDTAEGKLVAILSETAARRYWPGMNPVGKRFASGSLDRFGSFRLIPPGQDREWREIVGVVGDVRAPGFDSGALPIVYYSYTQSSLFAPALLIRTEGEPVQLASAVRGAIHDLNPRVVVTRTLTMEDAVSESISEPKLRAWLVALFAGLAQMFGMLGVYSVASYNVTRRSQEIGIRIALGARAAEIAGMILGRSCALAAVGIVLGLLASTAAVRAISSLLFQIQPLDPLTLAASCLLLFACAILASYLPARRAMRIDPAAALRNE
jgi:predicted permease